PDFPSVSRGAQDSRETGLRAGFLLSAIWLIRPANKKRQRWSRDAAFYPSCCLPSSAKKNLPQPTPKRSPADAGFLSRQGRFAPVRSAGLLLIRDE
ncbi:TPA: hypothetical protein ACQQ5A_003795, partial [Pseudomonas aeruginosa]